MRQALVGQVDAMLGDWRSPQVRWGKSSGQKKGQPEDEDGNEVRWVAFLESKLGDKPEYECE